MDSTVVLKGLNEIVTKFVINNNPTVAILTNIVDLDGLMLGAIPSHMQTAAIVLAAVTQNGLALQYCSIPQTMTIASAAINQNGLALKYIDRNVFSSGEESTLQIAACAKTFKALEYCKPITNAELAAAFP